MSNTKHTPLPWKTFIRGRVIEVKPKPFGLPIVGWTGFDESDVPIETHKANARLIVRAVNAHNDLLAACKEARQWLGDAPPDGEGEFYDELRRVLSIIDAAIAKGEA